MSERKTSTLSNGILWFGAAVSIAEIVTGALIAPLGIAKGIFAIVLGHAIGCILFYFAGIIGAETKMASLESSAVSFGKGGSRIFSVLNVLQLIGWTAVMIIIGAGAFNHVTKQLWGIDNEMLWSAAIGLLILVWVAVGITNLGKLNTVAVGALLVLSAILSAVVLRPSEGGILGGEMSFAGAVELSVAMPVSWLPLISDYTRHAQKPKSATLASVISYFFGSCWMYLIGLFAAIYAGTSDISEIMLKAGLGTFAIIIILLSTVTTTFLDVYSAGVSFVNVKKVSEKKASIILGVAGTLIAIFTPISQYENFLYLIGSVFVPMTAILITDYFIFKKKTITQGLNYVNLGLWVAGFAIYRLFINIDTVLGSTIPVALITMALSIIINGGMKYVSRNHK
jgi:putative hydroxymethylpyrimidine transporter CytX